MAGMWHKTLVYFGLADEDEDYDDETITHAAGRRVDLPGAAERAGRSTSSSRAPPVVDRLRRHLRRGRLSLRAVALVAARLVGPYRCPTPVEQPPVRVHLVVPKNFNDAQIIADKFKGDIPVILNLQQSETELAKRLIDFASGLTYALDGGMQRVADKVFLLTPKNVEVSAEERQRLAGEGLLQPVRRPRHAETEQSIRMLGTTVGVVGTGNMGAALVRGWLRASDPDVSFLVYDVIQERVDELALDRQGQ